MTVQGRVAMRHTDLRVLVASLILKPPVVLSKVTVPADSSHDMMPASWSWLCLKLKHSRHF